MNKRGVESVEIWMWLIAGMIICSLIFAGGFTLLSRYIVQKEVNQAYDNYEIMLSEIRLVCESGLLNQEIRSHIFPARVINLSVVNSTSGYVGYGDSLCISLDKKSDTCSIVRDCALNMTPVQMNQKAGLFYIVNKALGESQSTAYRFEILKPKRDKIEIKWKQDYLR